MAISEKTIKILWSAAAGRCSYPGCWQQLSISDAGEAAPHTIGEMAHIRGEREGSRRHDPAQSPAERDDYQNLILLCPTHHTLIDRSENEAKYTVEVLLQWKSTHEQRVLERLDIDEHDSKTRVAQEILILLAENRESRARYGPTSNIAKKEPNNESVHAVWLSERLSIIVPNNRRIAEILRVRRSDFGHAAQAVISSFLIHQRSYDSWVSEEIPYSAVVRFPVEFENLIRDTADASTKR